MSKYEVDDRSSRILGINFGCVSVDYTCASANAICAAADAICAGVNTLCADATCTNVNCLNQIRCSGGGFGGGGGGSWRMPGTNR